jgi:hypothetical protein
VETPCRPVSEARSPNAVARAELERWARSRASAPAPEAWIDDVTVLVKTFERPRCVVRLIQSLRAHLPEGLRALVCDDSREPLFADGDEPVPGVSWRTLPFAAGHTLGAGRNFLVDRTPTPFFFLCDDDHTFNPHTRVGRMHRFLRGHGYDIVGGAQGAHDYGAAVFERAGGICYQHFYRHRGLVAPCVVACDRVSNTFLARTAAVARIRWEERVYAHEHADFFLRAAAAGLKIAQMGRTWVGHDRGCEPARGWVGTVFGRWLAHRDGRYRNLRLGGDGGDRHARRRAAELYRRHVLDRHGVREIRDVSRRRDRRALEALIGKPTEPWP